MIDYFPTVIDLTMTSDDDEEAESVDNSKALVVYNPHQLR